MIKSSKWQGRCNAGPLTLGLIAALVAYIAACFGKIAGKHGKNPVLYGLLSIVSPINLIILGYWAFSDYETEEHPAPCRCK